MEKLIWFSDNVRQVDKLVLSDDIKKLPTVFHSIDDFNLELDKEYSLALVYHQTLARNIPFFKTPEVITPPADETPAVETPADETPAETPAETPVDTFSDITNDDRNKYKNFSNMLIRLVKKYNITRLDLLTCDTNESMPKQIDGLTIRYSLDKTGNEEESTNWILESHDVNIKTEYFTSTQGFTEVLTNFFNSLTADEFETSDHPEGSGKIYKLKSDITIDLDSTSHSLELLENNDVFDGQGYTISLSGTSYYFNGLFYTGGTAGTENIIVKNLRVSANGQINSNDYKGWIASTNDNSFGCGSGSGNKFSICNCLVDGDSSSSSGYLSPYSGFISGAYGGKNGGHLSLDNCIVWFPDHTNDTSFGTICGEYCGYESGKLTARNCISVYNVSGNMTSCSMFYAPYNADISNCLSMNGVAGSYPEKALVNSGSAVTRTNCYYKRYSQIYSSTSKYFLTASSTYTDEYLLSNYGFQDISHNDITKIIQSFTQLSYLDSTRNLEVNLESNILAPIDSTDDISGGFPIWKYNVKPSANETTATNTTNRGFGYWLQFLAIKESTLTSFLETGGGEPLLGQLTYQRDGNTITVDASFMYLNFTDTSVVTQLVGEKNVDTTTDEFFAILQEKGSESTLEFQNMANTGNVFKTLEKMHQHTETLKGTISNFDTLKTKFIEFANNDALKWTDIFGNDNDFTGESLANGGFLDANISQDVAIITATGDSNILNIDVLHSTTLEYMTKKLAYLDYKFKNEDQLNAQGAIINNWSLYKTNNTTNFTVSDGWEDTEINAVDADGNNIQVQPINNLKKLIALMYCMHFSDFNQEPVEIKF